MDIHNTKQSPFDESKPTHFNDTHSHRAMKMKNRVTRGTYISAHAHKLDVNTKHKPLNTLQCKYLNFSEAQYIHIFSTEKIWVLIDWRGIFYVNDRTVSYQKYFFINNKQ